MVAQRVKREDDFSIAEDDPSYVKRAQTIRDRLEEHVLDSRSDLVNIRLQIVMFPSFVGQKETGHLAISPYPNPQGVMSYFLDHQLH